MSGGVDKVAFEAIEYIAGAVYIAFDRIHSVTRETSRKEISYEEQVTVAIQGFLLLPSSEANHDFRNMCLTQAQR